jgi:2-phosphosulfolactate phosphatase
MNIGTVQARFMSVQSKIDVYLLPTLVEADELRERTVVVVDVLRATTTIIQALAAGAAEVIPCLDVDEARQIAARIGPSAILGGERGGMQIPGFDLGNSPAEYSSQRVRGKKVIFTTTNGTRAMMRCKAARQVLIGAFVNFSAVCREIASQERLAILCAGTDGQVTREDTLLAGALVNDLQQNAKRIPPGRPAPTSANLVLLNDQAEIAADAWRHAVRMMTDRPLGMTLRESRGGRNLIDIGHASDIDLAAQIDKFDIVPQLDLSRWSIHV